MSRPPSDPIQRFKAKVKIMSNGCHEWQSTINRGGYGKFYYKQRQDVAHRASYELFVGPTNGRWVLHKCDNRRCVNPDHLFLGNAQENIADMDAKGRRGSTTTTTLEFAEKVRSLLAERYSQQYVADLLGVSQSLVSRIHRNVKKFYKH